MGEVAFGRYRLIELLGRGGMGEVWRAHDSRTDRIVAIKVLPAHFSDDPTFQQRFRREAHAAARVDNPHVIPIHDYGEIDGRLYVDMRLIRGRDLHSVLASGPIEPVRAVHIIEQVAKALHAAHRVGLVHRDVKPSNILLDEDDFAYLIDFGIARAADDTRMTGTGNAIGTFHYIAPERLGGHPDDARADIYALACVLYECLTGKPPFAGSTMASLVADHLNTPPPKASGTQPNVPTKLDGVIAAGMAKDPDQRYATTVGLAKAARQAITTPQPQSSPAAKPHSQPKAAASEPKPIGKAKTPPATAKSPPALPRSAAPAPPQPSRPIKPNAHQGNLGPWKPPRKVLMAAAAALAAVIIAAGVYHGRGGSLESSLPPVTISEHGARTELSFNNLNYFYGFAVDPRGAVYGSGSIGKGSGDYKPGVGRVVKWMPETGSGHQLPISDLVFPGCIAADSESNVYVANYFPDGGFGHSQVVKFAAGSNTQSALPFGDLHSPAGIAVDAAGSVYFADSELGHRIRVLKLAAGTSAPTVLPFTGLWDVRGIAVDAAGDVFVTDEHLDSADRSRVLKLESGSNTQVVLPFGDVQSLGGVAVDSIGNVYVVDTSLGEIQAPTKLLRLAAGSSSPTALPAENLGMTSDLAVDAANNLYYIAGGKVIKTPAL